MTVEERWEEYNFYFISAPILHLKKKDDSKSLYYLSLHKTHNIFLNLLFINSFFKYRFICTTFLDLFFVWQFKLLPQQF